MNLAEKVSLNWLATTTDDCLMLESLVRVLEIYSYDVEKHIAPYDKLILNLIVRIRNVYDVLEQLRDKTTQEGDTAPELRDLLRDFVLAMHRFRQFLKRFSEENFLCRLIRNEKMVDAIQQAHDGIDIFIDGVQRSRFGRIFNELAKNAKIDIAVLNQSEADWRTKVDITSQKLQDTINQFRSRPARSGNEEEKEGSTEVKELTKVVKELLEITSKDQGKDSELQTAMLKALWTLMFETRRSSRRGTTDSLAAVVERELGSLTANVIPMPWFIPSDEITVNHKIDAGGFGAVFLGMLGFKTQVAVKRMHINIFDADALRREISIWYQLKHPNIIQFYGATFLDSDCSVVSEFAQYGSLDKYLTISGNKKHIWRLLYEAALGLHYMHDMDYVHGDLKCDNILIGDDMKAKVADFGLSFKNGNHRNVDCSQAHHWAAPECLDRTRQTERSFPTDVYMLGMCIVEALIGGPPYGGTINTAARRFIKQGELPISVLSLAPDVQELVKAMCAFDPADRMKLEDVIATLKQFADANNPDLVRVSGIMK